MTAPNVQQINIPSKPQTTGASTGRNQKDRRYMDTFWDIHTSSRFPRGRPWCGPREIAANTELMHEDGFCIPDLMQGEYVEDDNGAVDRGATLASSWHAPWKPLAKYFRFNYPRKRIRFDYDRMRLDESRSIDEYYQSAAKLGAQLKMRVEYGVIPDFAITAVIGEPTKFLKIAEAATAGDPWLLGHIDEPNPDLAAILGYNQHGMKIVSYEPAPVMTPAQVLATPEPQLMALLERLTAQVSVLSDDYTARKAKGRRSVGAKRSAQDAA